MADMAANALYMYGYTLWNPLTRLHPTLSRHDSLKASC